VLRNISIYFHFPFCIKKCDYCGFYSVPYDADLVEKYCASLRKSISRFPNKSEYQISTIYFGGGTPSLLPFSQLYTIIDTIRNHFSFVEELEVTLEANPINISKSSAQNFKLCGINRVSLGAQSFLDTELKLLGRLHSRKQILTALEYIRKFCTDNVSLDIMYGIPSQTMKSWMQTLKEATELNPKHISSYCLSLEDNTYMKNNADQYDFPNEELQSKMYYRMIDFLAERNFDQYEISNFSKQDFESRHNLTLWQGEEYIGLGAAAHSFYNLKRISNMADVKNYCENIQKDKSIKKFEKKYPYENISLIKLFWVYG